jgi:hypothetical protein
MAVPSTPADKSKPDKSNKLKKSRPLSPPRRKNRFNEREFARACRAARAVGAEKVSCDPKTGVYTITFSDKDAAARADTDLLNSADQARRSGTA